MANVLFVVFFMFFSFFSVDLFADDEVVCERSVNTCIIPTQPAPSCEGVKVASDGVQHCLQCQKGIVIDGDGTPRCQGAEDPRPRVTVTGAVWCMTPPDRSEICTVCQGLSKETCIGILKGLEQAKSQCQVKTKCSDN